jgi:uncharacterized membrane protein YfcA
MSIYLPIAEQSLNLALLLAMGYGVGILSGMFGIGGGFIMTPMLIMLGVQPIIAVGTGAAQVVASSVAGSVRHWLQGNVDLRMGGLLIAGGLFGATSGVRIQLWLKSLGQLDFTISLIYVVMLGTIGSLMLVESVNAWRRSAAAGSAGPARRAGQHTWLQRLPWKMRFPRSKLYASAIPPLAIGTLVGWLTAIMGVGGGFLLVPALIYVVRMPTRAAIGTSVFQIIFVTGFTTVLQATQNFNVDIALGLPIMLGGVIGAQHGIRIAGRIRAEQLRILLALMVLAVGLKMGVELVSEPSELYALDHVPSRSFDADRED